MWLLLWLRMTIVALALQLIWYYSTSWVSNICDLVLVFIFWFKIIKSGWFCVLGIIASNFPEDRKWLNYSREIYHNCSIRRNSLFPQFLENSRSHSNAYNTLIFLKKHAPIKWEKDWWFYEKYVWYYHCPSELWEGWK